MPRSDDPQPAAVRSPGRDRENGDDDTARFREAVSGNERRVVRGSEPRLDGGVPPTGSAQSAAWTLSGGGQRASGAGVADGGIVRPDGSIGVHCGSRFDVSLTPGGYAWWYIDALSDDRCHGLTMIAFIGSAFSPYYSASRRLGGADPENHVAMNAAIYGRQGYRWAMTERGRSQLKRSSLDLQIGPSGLAWDGARLRVVIKERAAPLPYRVEGELEIIPNSKSMAAQQLDVHGRHLWQPIAPCARICVRLARPKMTWSGTAYMDSNVGTEPLADAFRNWSWSRSIEGARTRIYYDIERLDGSTHALALSFAPGESGSPIEAPDLVRIGRTKWRLPLDVRSQGSEGAGKLEAWEDGPFYARSLVQHRLDGHPEISVHECLSLERFERSWVQALLPFRMPRWAL